MYTSYTHIIIIYRYDASLHGSLTVDAATNLSHTDVVERVCGGDDYDDERTSRGEQRDTPPCGGRPLVADAAAVKETAPIFFLNWNHVIPAVYLLFRNRINRTRREYTYLPI